ncbi:MAG: hypothetical protein AB7P14_21950 [Blastocatellales bacterium]
MNSENKYETGIFLRALAAWFVIILGETLHGIARTALLQPYIGDFRARQIAVFSGTLIIITIAVILIRWINANSKSQLLIIGTLWVCLTICFEIGLGTLILGYSWERMLSDYNLAKGGLLAIGMVALFFAPLIAAKIRGLKEPVIV